MDLSEQHSKSSQGENACNLLLSFFFLLKKNSFRIQFYLFFISGPFQLSYNAEFSIILSSLTVFPISQPLDLSFFNLSGIHNPVRYGLDVLTNQGEERFIRVRVSPHSIPVFFCGFIYHKLVGYFTYKNFIAGHKSNICAVSRTE